MAPLKVIAVIAVIAFSGSQIVCAAADALKITIPKRSELTRVQRLNREGVEALEKNKYEKASELFYKAYLYDPADPFTLNNMGYISELQGELDLATKFYALASEQECTADIDRSNAKQLEGKPMLDAVQSYGSGPMRLNGMNVQAINLLSESRGFEAVALLQQALAIDPRNPYTLNNLGVAHEVIGDFDNALKYYRDAASSQSSDSAIITKDRAWRGRPISSMAALSATRLHDRIQRMGPAEARVLMLTVRGVAAVNMNNWPAAKQDFLDAYALDPTSAFSLNNRGYVAEKDGDLETAQFFYNKARQAADSDARVGSATNQNAEGKTLATVSADSHQNVDGELERYSAQRHRQTGPIELTPRDTVPTNAEDPSSKLPSASH